MLMRAQSSSTLRRVMSTLRFDSSFDPSAIDTVNTAHNRGEKQ